MQCRESSEYQERNKMSLCEEFPKLRRRTALDFFNSFLFDLLLVDIRSKEEFDQGHIACACWYGELEKHFGERWEVLVYDDDGSTWDDLDHAPEHIVSLLRDLHTSPTFVDVKRVSVLSPGGFQAFHKEYPFMCTDAENFDFSVVYPQQITDSIFLGSQISSNTPEVFRDLKLTHVVNAATELPCPFKDTTPEGFSFGPIQYLHLDLEDAIAANLITPLRRALPFLKSAVDSGGRILVHCQMGQSRSAAVVIAYLVAERQWPVTEAAEYVRECRGVARPNAGFMRALHSVEDELLDGSLWSV